MSGSRNERLSRLFHTKVLGHVDPGVCVTDYCSSLDAAWEGAQSLLGERFQSVSICVPEKGEFCVYSASLDDLCSESDATFSDDQYGTSMAHPAEALVLACLRAVGCTEEELK